ncbi:FMN-binding negative transcriptional regulator [Bradyrhizobium sp. i1.15.2]|uniref:FMN-binding negative transcriptional regulator n=1 Tax=Bradyrhizobium sp. i1.15.2 TaxID=3156362 RepID=UPI003399D7EF
MTKHDTGEAVPTWNYVAVHAYGRVEFFDDADRLRGGRHAADRYAGVLGQSWAISDAPADFVKRGSRGLSVCDCKLHGSMARGR